MRISLITVNYNGSEATIRLLESLKNQSDKDFEIIIVDNNSDDVGKLTDYQVANPSIILLRNDQNLGFSGGNNVGIKKALENDSSREPLKQADWVILLNNDTLVENGFIERLKAILGPRGGIVGVALDEGDRTVFAGRIEWLKPTLSHIIDYALIKGDSHNNYYAIGGAMAIHKDVFNKIGLLDENYFLYFEDADFCLRAIKNGIPIFFTDKILVRHQVSSTTKKLGSPLLLRYHYRNALYFNYRNGPWYIKMLISSWIWWIIDKQLLKLIIKKDVEQSLAILKGINDWSKNRMGQIT